MFSKRLLELLLYWHCLIDIKYQLEFIDLKNAHDMNFTDKKIINNVSKIL